MYVHMLTRLEGDNGKVGLIGSGDGDGDRTHERVAMKMDNC